MSPLTAEAIRSKGKRTTLKAMVVPKNINVNEKRSADLMARAISPSEASSKIPTIAYIGP